LEEPHVRQLKRVQKVRGSGNWNVRDTAACVCSGSRNGASAEARRMEEEGGEGGGGGLDKWDAYGGCSMRAAGCATLQILWTAKPFGTK
jgi:hypothetical protein